MALTASMDTSSLLKSPEVSPTTSTSRSWLNSVEGGGGGGGGEGRNWRINIGHPYIGAMDDSLIQIP